MGFTVVVTWYLWILCVMITVDHIYFYYRLKLLAQSVSIRSSDVSESVPPDQVGIESPGHQIRGNLCHKNILLDKNQPHSDNSFVGGSVPSQSTSLRDLEDEHLELQERNLYPSYLYPINTSLTDDELVRIWMPSMEDNPIYISYENTPLDNGRFYRPPLPREPAEGTTIKKLRKSSTSTSCAGSTGSNKGEGNCSPTRPLPKTNNATKKVTFHNNPQIHRYCVRSCCC